jgi:hypothetical protein
MPAVEPAEAASIVTLTLFGKPRIAAVNRFGGPTSRSVDAPPPLVVGSGDLGDPAQPEITMTSNNRPANQRCP